MSNPDPYVSRVKYNVSECTWNKVREHLMIIILSSSNQICFLSLFKAVVRTFITPLSFCERLTFITVTGRRREFVSHRSTWSASPCFTWNRLNKSPMVLLQKEEAKSHYNIHNTIPIVIRCLYTYDPFPVLQMYVNADDLLVYSI